MNKVMGFLLSNEFGISFICILAILSMSIPYGFPLFFPVVLFYYLISLFKGKLKIKINLNLGIALFYICIVFYIYGIANSSGVVYEHNILDLQNILSYMLLIFLFSNNDASQFNKFINIFAILSAIVVTILAVFSLVKFYLLLNGIKIPLVLNGVEAEAQDYPWGTSLVTDYNMFAYSLFIGIFSLINCLKRSQKVIVQILIMMSIMLVSTSIIFAGSRRAWIIFGFVILSYVIYSFYNIRRTKSYSKIIKLVISIMIALSFISFFVSDFNISVTNTYEIEKLSYRFSTISTETNTIDSFSSRTNRWDFAYQLMGNYSLMKLFFGDGFYYLRQYADEFDPGLVLEDYPHNPILSALHYSGLIGALFVTLLILLPILKLFRNSFSIEFICLYFVSLFFVIPSGNSIFSIKIFAIFIITILTAKRNQIDSIYIPNFRTNNSIIVKVDKVAIEN